MRKDLQGVLVQVNPENRHICEAIAAEGFPMVALAATFEGGKVNWAVCDTRAEMRSAVEHLAALGHRRIALAVRSTLDHDHQARLAAFEEAVADLGLDRDPQLVLRLEPTIDAGMSAVRQLMACAAPPTAIVFTNSQTTVGALRACHELGLRVPEDLSLVGFDDARVRFSTHPPFTAVCQDSTALGREAALWLARCVDGDVAGLLRLRLQGTFEVHGTTGYCKTHELPIYQPRQGRNAR
jgi:DNA-binding LacI/PurR family transcriptional regulator